MTDGTTTPGLSLDRPRWRLLVDYSEREWLRCLLLVLFGAGVHVPALQGPLLWDDIYLARDNPFTKSPLLIIEAFRHYLFPDTFFGHYRPVQTVSYVFDYFVWNTDACGYHLSNIVLHVVAAILLYRLLKSLLPISAQMFKEEGDNSGQIRQEAILSMVAFLIALLWVIHPVHSAAVDYISGRADSLAFLFACGGWLLYMRARANTRNLLRSVVYTLAVLSAMLSLCSRETGLIWMLIFLLHLFIFDRKPGLRMKLAILSICVGIVAAYGALRAIPEHRPAPVGQTTPVAVKGMLMLRALGDYGRLMIWPSNLRMERDVTDADSFGDTQHWRQAIRAEYLSIIGLFVAAILLYGALRKGTAQSIRILGAGWFLIAYLPISNLFELNATVAEHWLYLPSVGFLIFVAGCFLETTLIHKHVAIVVTCIAVLGLTSRCFIRSTDWSSAETFYRRTLLAGASSIRVCVNLALIYSAHDEKDKAERILRKVLKANPDYLVARNNLATILSQRGQDAEARELLKPPTKTKLMDRALSPRPWMARLNLVTMARNENDDEKALAMADEAYRDYPYIWETVSCKADLTRKVCGPEAALPIVKEFTEKHWWHCKAHIALGKLYWESGDVANAEQVFRDASWLDVHDTEALSVLAVLKMQQNRLQDAFETQSRAVARQPDDLRPNLLLSDILNKMGRTADAKAVLDRVSRLQSFAQAQPALE